MDTRQLMYNHQKATDTMFDDLAQLIEEGFDYSKQEIK